MTTMAMISKTGERMDAMRVEFGAILADRILETELLDFLWEARIGERYLGQHFSEDWICDGDGEELSRVAIMSVLNGRFQIAACVVDGEGVPSELIWRRDCHGSDEANSMFATAH
ncbi:hypothetical protein [Allosphingosinicella indica]|uniref:Uncharacterized protein n=1 Tax=Allosphingosinicella indica TaxID=941907 RepID=A0A1X7FYN8_9SPHN|nr:hypothetical protein [Allosphingosinicella indica]SMF61179.1 hypothetical protein SAMN06295910_0161 [Allosphingosinicella indica]